MLKFNENSEANYSWFRTMHFIEYLYDTHEMQRKVSEGVSFFRMVLRRTMLSSLDNPLQTGNTMVLSLFLHIEGLPKYPIHRNCEVIQYSYFHWLTDRSSIIMYSMGSSNNLSCVSLAVTLASLCFHLRWELHVFLLRFVTYIIYLIMKKNIQIFHLQCQHTVGKKW